MKYLEIDDFKGTVSEEIGGGNGIQPMLVAAEMGRAVLDCDLMGRAYPNVGDRPCCVRRKSKQSECFFLQMYQTWVHSACGV